MIVFIAVYCDFSDHAHWMFYLPKWETENYLAVALIKVSSLVSSFTPGCTHVLTAALLIHWDQCFLFTTQLNCLGTQESEFVTDMW